ncbi:hypothetical protein A5719_17635 [Mycolicibacterium peregrinum]|nr:hypothetical protein A5719_17635 [Mycolicibacterium peregrinum]
MMPRKGDRMGDVGTQVVDAIYDQLKVETQWALRRPRGFTWWSYRLAQHIDVSPPVHDRGLDLCNMTIRTDMVRDVDPDSNPAAILAQLNRQATVNALVWDPTDSTISVRCAVTVHQDIASWIYYVLATAAILQNDLAHSQTVALAQACGGSPAGSNHPTHGVRNEPNSSMDVPARMITPAGGEPSKFIGAQCVGLERFLAELAEVKGWYGNVDAEGATVEVPYSGQRPAMFQDRGSAGARLETALVRVFTDVSHPQFGNGALMVMQLPVSPGPDWAASLANDLNSAESAGGYDVPPLFGAWVPDPFSDEENGLAFSCFLPNFLAMGGILNNWMVYQATRAQFARRFLDE